MTKKKNKEEGISTGGKLAVGAGVAALSVAGYLLFGPEGKKNRKKISGWAVKMKGEMIERFEEVKDITEPVYNQIVDEISKKYAKAKGVSEEEITGVVSEIKKHWKAISKDAKKLVSNSKTPTKKAVKKIAKIVAKKK